MSKVLTDTLARIPQNIFPYSFASEHYEYKHCFYFEKKDASPKNASFFDVPPYHAFKTLEGNVSRTNLAVRLNQKSKYPLYKII